MKQNKVKMVMKYVLKYQDQCHSFLSELLKTLIDINKLFKFVLDFFHRWSLLMIAINHAFYKLNKIRVDWGN